MKFTILDFKRQFADPDLCLSYLFLYRFGPNYACPHCGKTSWYRIKGRKAYSCPDGHHINPLAGTVFHKSPTDLVLWFFAIYKFANSRNGVAAKELQRDLGVTYKTAWRMAKQIRSLMKSGDDKLFGTVEIDEAYIKTSGKGRKNLSKIAAFVTRGGQVQAFDMQKLGLSNPARLIHDKVEKGSTIMTDGARIYLPYYHFLDYKMKSVIHSKKEFVRGDAHTNTAEGFFSQIKRSIAGTYHRVSPKHLHSYLDEFAWRLTYARSETSLFWLLLERLCRLPGGVG